METIALIDLHSASWDEDIGRACRDTGFFYVKNHDVSLDLQIRLEEISRRFFTLPQAEKMQIAMTRANRAWRGYFPVGQELTSGKPDRKEGIYFGEELPAGQPLPLHGPNLFPNDEMREVVLEYLSALTILGHRLMGGVSLSLGLAENYFHDTYTRDPLVLFRIFNYPPTLSTDPAWGVGEHTDYGLLTILKQDDLGGLEVRSRGGWVAAPPIPNTFVCNLGDMLDRLTGGMYRSTPHRVRNVSGKARLSFPFFFDPNFHAEILPLPEFKIREDKEDRWDKSSVHTFKGTYGKYLLEKVSKVFPELGKQL